jgi:GH25 family lysozyme M1 (1,4-beta-N-acetylmuramidase)
MVKERRKKRLTIIGFAVVAVELILILAVVYACSNLPEPVAPTKATTVSEPSESIHYHWQILPPRIPLNDYSAEDFVMVDGFMTHKTVPYMVGIDVSSHQGEIDWKLVKEAGVEFVIIRLGYRGYGEEGRLVKDPKAQEYYEGAKEQGLLVGGYVFSQALTEQEAVEEAEMALEVTADWQLDLPVAFDWEFLHFEARTQDMVPRLITNCAKAFCSTLEAGGVQPMLYTGLYVKTLKLEELKQYPMWLALYSENMSYDYWMNFWQYSCTGKVPGIETDVDLNIYLPKTEEP